MVPTYDSSKTIRYTLKSDTDDIKTEFHLGVLDAKEESYLNTQYTGIAMKGNGKRDSENNLTLEPIITIDRGGKDIETVALRLKGVTNFGGTLSFTEKTYPFGKRNILTDSALDLVKPYIEELAGAIRSNSEFTSESGKN